MSQQPVKMGESSGSANPGNSKASKASKASKPKSKSKPKAGPKVGQKEIDIKTFAKDCAFLFGNAGPVIASGPAFGLGSKISACLTNDITPSNSAYFRVQLVFPRGADQVACKDKGFGVCHSFNKSARAAMPANHILVIKFPCSKNTCLISPIPLAISSMFLKIEN